MKTIFSKICLRDALLYQVFLGLFGFAEPMPSILGPKSDHVRQIRAAIS